MFFSGSNIESKWWLVQVTYRWRGWILQCTSSWWGHRSGSTQEPNASKSPNRSQRIVSLPIRFGHTIYTKNLYLILQLIENINHEENLIGWSWFATQHVQKRYDSFNWFQLFDGPRKRIIWQSKKSQVIVWNLNQKQLQLIILSINRALIVWILS